MIAMTSTELPSKGIVFWPVGTGDSVTIVVDEDHVIQVDIHHMVMADDPDATVSAVVDRLVEVLPKGPDGRPYLAVFVLTHADKDHCLGFAELLERVTIGEIWATPRLWREYLDEGVSLCADAEAFHEEVKRRVAATLTAAEAGGMPVSGDRILVIGHDRDQYIHDYADLPAQCRTGPGHVVTRLDGDEMGHVFEAFIHAPFKDDCAAPRNDTSLAMQVTLMDEEGAKGHVLLFGDLAHDTIMKIFDYSEAAERSERLAWDVFLAPHHCSKRVMYRTVDGEDILQPDVLDALARHGTVDATFVVSSGPFPPSNHSGDNPPHVKARNRYAELVDNPVLCTSEHPDPDAPEPIVFVLEREGLVKRETEALAAADRMGKGAAAALVAGGMLARLAASGVKASRRQAARPHALSGLSRVREAVAATRGDNAAPQQPIGFGRA